MGYRYMVGLCLHCQSGKHVGRECEKVRFKRGSCCYTCGLPQRAYGKDIHGNVRTGECEEGLRDIVRGGCWGCILGVRNGYVCGGEWRDWMDGMKESLKMDWRVEESGEMVNGAQLMMEVWRGLKSEWRHRGGDIVVTWW